MVLSPVQDLRLLGYGSAMTSIVSTSRLVRLESRGVVRETSSLQLLSA
jgi:hypothetical protein